MVGLHPRPARFLLVYYKALRKKQQVQKGLNKNKFIILNFSSLSLCFVVY